MEESIKIIISGLDFAGKTSIITALNRKYDFQKEVTELKPTFKIEYHSTSFLNRVIRFWDMGGQEKFRSQYQSRADMYFGETDLLLYIIDIQDTKRFETSLEYLESILTYFIDSGQDVPLIIALHKYDPEIRGEEEVNNNVESLKDTISQKYPDFKILFQLTSIYDIISIVQLISYGLSIFDEKFFDLSELLEAHIEALDCSSLILFDENGIIVSEFYSEIISPEIYVKLIESIKDHLYLLKRMQEENYKESHNLINIEEGILSYLHRITIADTIFYISIIIQEEKKERLLDKFAEFNNNLSEVLLKIIS